MNRVDIAPISDNVLAGISEESRASIQRLADFLAKAELPDLSVGYSVVCTLVHMQSSVQNSVSPAKVSGSFGTLVRGRRTTPSFAHD